MKKLRVGIVGLGEFGELHVTAFSQIPYVEITRVCSRTASRAKEIADKYHVPAISTDYEEFACSDDVDVVSVATLSRDHRVVSVAALESGKHVLLEKPIADSLDDAEAIAAAAKRSAGKFMTAHICRFMPPYAHAKSMIDLGKLGEISMIQAYRNNHYTTLSPGRKLNPMRETAIHDIDLALWFTGSDVEECSGYKRYNQSDKEADSTLAVVKLTNGTLCSFASSWMGRDAMPAGLDAMMKIIGTKGEIEIKMPPDNFRFIDDAKHYNFNPETSLDPIILRQSALATEIEYFLRCVLEDKEPEVVTPEDALKTLRASIEIDKNCT
ncbi:MAG: Gfo/Idh/MocA family oxidoreductase [Armatimonadota bacterium]